MDKDAMKDVVSLKQNGNLSEYNLDSYDEEDDGLVSSASGHAVFGITTYALPSFWSFHWHQRLTVPPRQWR